jgi:uncharacterized membrane protein YgdD (TMEM256/DUF423 family)
VSDRARWVAFSGALLALLAVILGAMGSHVIGASGLVDAWEAANRMHLFNAAGLLGLAALLARHDSRLLLWGAWALVLGTLLFAGSIYLHVITGYKITNMAPAGGVLMMLGWLLAAIGLVWKS